MGRLTRSLAMRMKKAVVFLSGGMDSATVLAIAQSQHYGCYALSFHYGQSHKAELNANEKLRVNELFENGLAPFQILDVIHSETKKKHHYTRVYNSWLQCSHAKLKRDSDPLVSAVQYAKESSVFD